METRISIYVGKTEYIALWTGIGHCWRSAVARGELVTIGTCNVPMKCAKHQA